MAKRSAENPQLKRVTEIALKLPETTRKIYGSHAQFLVRKKTFAYFLDNHHGDGIVSITGKVLPGDNKALAESQPKRFYLPAYIGSKGWVALRLTGSLASLSGWRNASRSAGRIRQTFPARSPLRRPIFNHA